MYFQTHGVILKKKNFNEADRLLTIYTDKFGKISCLAKGVRRPTSRKSGHLEIANIVKMYLAKGKNLDIITEVQLEKSFAFKNFSQSKTNNIYHLMELVDLLTPLNQKNVRVYNLTTEYLEITNKSANFALLQLTFKLKLLSCLGFFTAKSLNSGRVKVILHLLEQKEFYELENTIHLKRNAYLKLANFLDSIIESISEAKLKTTRFIYG